MQAASNIRKPSPYLIDPQKLLGMISKWLDQPKTIEPAIKKCKELVIAGHALPVEIMNKLELQLQNIETVPQAKIVIYQLLLTLNCHKFQDSTIELFCKDLSNPILDPKIRELLPEILKKMMARGYNLFSSSIITDIFQQHLASNDSHLISSALSILHTSANRFELPENLKHYIGREDISVANNNDQKNHDGIKTLDSLLTELKEHNITNTELLKFIESGSLQKILQEIAEKYENDSTIAEQGKPIKTWEGEEIRNWSRAIRSNSQSTECFIPEILAVIKKANYLSTGHDIRDTQFISLITLFNTKDKGRLLQIATGEGKSTTTAVTALVKAITGYKVDVVTSSPILAIRDVDEWQGFFEMFGVTSGHNINKNYKEGPKDCYLKDIVYGDAHNFQSDILLDEYKDLGTRGSRKFAESCVIIDEVDSMLVDESAKIVKLSNPMPCMEYLEPIFVMSWQQLSQFTNYFAGDSEALKANSGLLEENISRYIKSLITGEDNNYEKIVIPKYLENFAFKQAEFWARSALTALQMTEKRDYLIIKDDNDEEVIAPIDYSSTGVIQEKTSWGNGLHQFLQVKHCLKISPENLNTSFISNMQYFKRYNSDRIYGMTGTLGSEDSQDLLKEIYNIDLVFVPSFKPNQFKELDGVVVDGSNRWREELTNSVSRETAKGKAVLVICETIEDVENIADDLQKVEGSNTSKIKTYSRSNDDQQKVEAVDSKDVIIATNLAGRGTDIKTSREVEAAGGLHVILSFLPTNLRVERQAFGRTARQGNQGTGQLILNDNYERIKLINLAGYRDAASIDEFRSWRDEGERTRIANTKNIKLLKIENEDLLFVKFNQLVKQLRVKENNKYKISQLEERWGLWLKEATDRQKGDNKEILLQFESFQAEMTDSYIHGNRIMQNPAYLTRSSDEAFIKGDYNKAISILREASALDPVYSFAARYNLAYALLRRNDDGKKNHQPYVDEAAENLVQVVQHIHQYILPQLQMMQILLGSTSNDSALSKQIAMKISLLQTQISYIEHALEVIQEKSDGKNLIKIKDYRSITELLGNNDEPKGEVLELARFGIVRLFEVDAKSPPKSWLSGAAMTLLGAAQLVVGTLVTVASGHPLGVQLIMDGAKDLYHGIRAIQGKEQIDWTSYLINKGVSYAISAVSMGWQKFQEGLKAIGTQVSNLATATKNFFTGAAIQTVGMETVEKITFSAIAKNFIEEQGVSKVAAVVLEVSKSIVIDRVTDIAVKKLAQQLDRTKEDIAERIERKILNALRNEPTKRQVEQLILLDRCSGRNIYSQQISKAAIDLLAPKKEMLGQLAQSLGSAAINGAASRSNNGTANVVAKIVTTVTPMAMAAEKIELLITEYASDLQVKIDSLAKTAFPRLENFLQAHVSPQISHSIASDIVEILVKNGVSIDKKLEFNTELLKEIYSNTPIVSSSSTSSRPAYMDNLRRSATKQENINEIDFGPYQEYRGGVLGCIKQVRNASSKGYDQEREELTRSISSNVISKVMSMIRGELLRPVVSPVVTYGVGEIIHHFEDAYNNTLKDIKHREQAIDEASKESRITVEEETSKTTMEVEEEGNRRQEPILEEVSAEASEEAKVKVSSKRPVQAKREPVELDSTEQPDHSAEEHRSYGESSASDPNDSATCNAQAATTAGKKPWPKNIGVVMPSEETFERIGRDLEAMPGNIEQIWGMVGEVLGVSTAYASDELLGEAQSGPIVSKTLLAPDSKPTGAITFTPSQQNQIENDFGVRQSIITSTERLVELSKGLAGYRKEFIDALIIKNQETLNNKRPDVVATYCDLAQRNAGVLNQGNIAIARAGVDILGETIDHTMSTINDIMLYNPLTGKPYHAVTAVVGAVGSMAMTRVAKGIQYVGQGISRVIGEETSEAYINKTKEYVNGAIESLNPGERIILGGASVSGLGVVTNKIIKKSFGAVKGLTGKVSVTAQAGSSFHGDLIISSSQCNQYNIVYGKNNKIGFENTNARIVDATYWEMPPAGHVGKLPSTPIAQSSITSSSTKPQPPSAPASSNTPLLLEYNPNATNHPSTPSVVFKQDARSPAGDLIIPQSNIIRGKDGKIQSLKLTQVHHIIHQKLSGDELWELAGMNIEDRINKMLLPQVEGAKIYRTTAAIHQGRHLKVVETRLAKKMANVVNRGTLDNYAQAQYKEKLIEIIQAEYRELKTGVLPLNKQARPNSIPLPEEKVREWVINGYPEGTASSLNRNESIGGSNSNVSSSNNNLGSQRSDTIQKDLLNNDHNTELSNQTPDKQLSIIKNINYKYTQTLKEASNSNLNLPAIAEHYINTVLNWIDYVTPEWLREMIMQSTPVREMYKHFEGYNIYQIKVKIVEEDITTLNLKERNEFSEDNEQSSLSEHAEVSKVKESETNKPNEEMILEKETIEIVVPQVNDQDIFSIRQQLEDIEIGSVIEQMSDNIKTIIDDTEISGDSSKEIKEIVTKLEQATQIDKGAITEQSKIEDIEMIGKEIKETTTTSKQVTQISKGTIAEQSKEIMFIEYQPKNTNQYLLTKEFLTEILLNLDLSSPLDSNMITNQSYNCSNDFSTCSIESDCQIPERFQLLGEVC